MEISSESTEELGHRNQRSSRPFFVLAGTIAGFKSSEPIFDDG
jgi:hypothetical protein